MFLRSGLLLSKKQRTQKKSSIKLLRRRKTDFWSGLKMGPPDPILGLTVAYNKDTFENKMNVGVGAYRDDSGKPFVLDCVRSAEKIIFESKMNHEYTGISGEAKYTTAAANLLFGEDSNVLKENLVCSSQSISGTGALRVAGNFLSRHFENDTIYVPNPTWGNHIPIFTDAGFKVEKYKYLHKDSGLDFSGLKDDLFNIPNKSIVLLHACAHNPTGTDPKPDQWKEISKLCLDKNHFILFDSAYQGFASGDVDGDAFAIRQFIEDGHKPMICQSFAKNFGLYGERAGCLHIIGNTPDEKAIIDSQLKILIRPMYSSPPIHGARIVSTILNDPVLKEKWFEEVQLMANRIIEMRDSLRTNLKEAGSTRDWSHITEQIGMFCYSGINPEQVDRLREEFHIYMTRDGRISMAGVTSSNVRYLANSIHAVTK